MNNTLISISTVLLLLGAAAQVALAGGKNLECTPLDYEPPPRGSPADAVKVQDSAFVRAVDGKPVAMKATSWWGVADNGTTPLASLWSDGSAAATDVPNIAYRLRAAGFNALRLPFNFDDLRAPPQKAWAKQGCHKVTLGSSSGGGSGGSSGDAPAAGAVGSPPAGGGGRCAWYLPDTRSSADRFLWALQWFVANGFYVLAEHRPAAAAGGSGGAGAAAAAALASPEAFADSWRWLWRRIACLPNFEADLAGRVFAGLATDPDSAGLRWEPVGGAAGAGAADGAADGSDGQGTDDVIVPGLTDLYLAAMDAVWADTPGRAVFFVSGAGQGGDATWGSGFETDKATIAVNDYSDPNPFFAALLRRPYRGAVALLPAVYASSAPRPPPEPRPPLSLAPVTPPAWPAGPGPVKVMDTTFTYLARDGYCTGGSGTTGTGSGGSGSSSTGSGDAPDCQRFPISVGDFGSALAAAPGELAALNAFAARLAREGLEYGGVGTWKYWAFDGAAAAGDNNEGAAAAAAS